MAVAHSYTDPENTVLYRVTVPAASTGTSWGDGDNGFFFQVELGNGDGDSKTLSYVPFNGIGAGSDGQPELPQFWFVVPADESYTTLAVSLCASAYMADSGSTPACTTSLWTDTYSTLPSPSVGDPPFSSISMQIAGANSTGVTVPNNGVYPAVVTLDVSNTDLSDADVEWLYDHMLFFDEDGDPYINDLFADSSESHRSIGVLSIDEAAYQDPVTGTYRSKYGSTNAIEKVDSPDRQFFFYTRDILGTSAIQVGIDYIYDASGCPGTTYSKGSNACASGAATSGAVGKVYVEVTPESDQNGAITAYPQNSVEAGEEENRTIGFDLSTSSLCTKVTNPLAINVAGKAYNQPDYVIDSGSGTWGMTFPNGLYYVLPTGFGNCDSTTTPFCHLTSSYAAYVPHYANSNGAFGTLNGGSTTDSTVGSLALADEYMLGDVGLGSSNSLVWFDNCGYGYVYEECSSCSYPLGTRQTLPSAPDDKDSSLYTVKNDLSFPIVLGKECCSSYYQENQTTGTYEPPAQLADGFGAFIPAGGSLSYETLFSDEAMVLYNATTGEELFKLRLNVDSPAVYSCGLDEWSATVGDTEPYSVEILESGDGSLECGAVGLCPFGMAESVDGDTVTCTVTESSFVLGLADWVAEHATSSVQLRAWGGSGHSGSSDSCQLHSGKGEGGSGGTGGFALTVQSLTDLASNLYVYIGKHGKDDEYGGSSTVVATTALSAATASASDVDDPTSIGMLLVAGGGGAGGPGLCEEDQNSASKESGGDGGAGGLAIANAESNADSVSVAGSAGGVGDSSVDSQDNGGNSDSLGSGGSGAGDGVGGHGGGGTGWDTSASLIPPSSWSAGEGGKGNNAYGGGGFGGGGHASSSDVTTSGAGGGGGGSWAAANTVYDSSAPTDAPDSPNGDGGAVELVYDLSCGSCGLCPSGTTSTTYSDGEVSCVLTASAVYDVGSWLTSAISLGLLSEDRELRLTAWGGHGGKMINTGKSGGSGGMASMSTSAGDLLDGSGTLYIYVANEGCSKDASSYTTGEAGTCGGSSTIVIDGQALSDLQVDGEPGDQDVILIAGGGGGAGTITSGGAGGVTTSTTDADGSAGGSSGGTCNSKTATGGNSGTGGTGKVSGNDGIGGKGGNNQNWIFGTDSNIDEPSGWTGGEGAKGTASENFGGSGGGGWGGGAAGDNGDCGNGGGGGGSYAAQSTVGATYAAASSSSPNGNDGAFELYYELAE